MPTRMFVVISVGILNTVLIIYLVVNPFFPSSERRWYRLPPGGAGERADPARGVLLPGSAVHARWGICGPEWATKIWRPSGVQIRHLEEDLARFLPVADSTIWYGAYLEGHPSLLTYHRQYLGFELFGDHPIIFVNAFLLDGPDGPLPWRLDNWRREMVCVDDGGEGYWHVEYDPVQRRFRGFDYNGTA